VEGLALAPRSVCHGKRRSPLCGREGRGREEDEGDEAGGSTIGGATVAFGSAFWRCGC
jgi:hypothetical protein